MRVAARARLGVVHEHGANDRGGPREPCPYDAGTALRTGCRDGSHRPNDRDSAARTRCTHEFVVIFDEIARDAPAVGTARVKVVLDLGSVGGGVAEACAHDGRSSASADPSTGASRQSPHPTHLSTRHHRSAVVFVLASQVGRDTRAISRPCVAPQV